VAQTREPLIIADASKDERFYSKADDATGFTTRNLLCVPILYRDELLGVVQVLNAKHKQTFEREELDLLRHFANLAAVALVRARLLDVKLHQERMTVQLDAASRIQEHFLPKTPELGYGSGIHARTKPAIFVGGDFYDFIPMPDGSHIVLVVDVSGKGLPAALIGAALWARTRSLALYAPDCCTLMEHLNRDMYEVMGNAMFATLVMGRYWPDSGEMELATAGHLPPLLVGDDYVTEVGELYGQPLGIDAEAGYHTRTITLERGQSVVLLTDGVTEARNARREFFGDDRLREYLLQACRPPRVQGLIRRVESWRGNAPANDDLTLVEIYRR
jgi:serine phosphatase RsbU (regulator of sigma subunit)